MTGISQGVGRLGTAARVLALLAASAVAGSATAAPRSGEIGFEIHPTHNVILVDVVIDGKRVTMILDTGATRTIVSPEAIGLSPARLRRAELQSRGPGFKGNGMWERVDLRVGDLRWSDHAVVVMEFGAVRQAYGEQVQGLLGQDVLCQIGSIELDFEARRIRWRR